MSEGAVDILSKKNEQNSSIINLDSSKIKTIKNNILQKIQLSRDDLKLYHTKLKDYRYCSDLSDLQYEITFADFSEDPDNLKLTKGAFYVDYFIEKNMVKIVVKIIEVTIFKLNLMKF